MSNTKQVPLSACLFKVGEFTIGKLASSKGANRTVPVSLRGRSGQPIDHWFWGRVVHDMAGFKAAAKTIPLDYCHNDSEILGFLDTFHATSAGLDCGGHLVILRDDDRASEVLQKSEAGVPYQASIYFDSDTAVVEQVPEGQSAKVNGYQLKGPAIIIRQWMLRGMAVCPYGYDHRTETRFTTTRTATVRLLTAEDAKFARLKLAGLSDGTARLAMSIKLPRKRGP